MVLIEALIRAASGALTVVNNTGCTEQQTLAFQGQCCKDLRHLIASSEPGLYADEGNPQQRYDSSDSPVAHDWSCRTSAEDVVETCDLAAFGDLAESPYVNWKKLSTWISSSEKTSTKVPRDVSSISKIVDRNREFLDKSQKIVREWSKNFKKQWRAQQLVLEAVGRRNPMTNAAERTRQDKKPAAPLIEKCTIETLASLPTESPTPSSSPERQSGNWANLIAPTYIKWSESYENSSALEITSQIGVILMVIGLLMGCIEMLDNLLPRIGLLDSDSAGRTFDPSGEEPVALDGGVDPHLYLEREIRACAEQYRGKAQERRRRAQNDIGDGDHIKLDEVAKEIFVPERSEVGSGDA